MLHTQRQSIIILFWSFLLYALPWLSYMRLNDPLSQWNPIVKIHPEVGILFRIIQYGGGLALLMLLAGGIPILYTVVKQAMAARRRDIVLLVTSSAVMLAIFLLISVLIIAGLWTLDHNGGILAIVGLLTFIVIAITLAIAIRRSDLNQKVLRFARITATIMTTAMLITLLATIIEVVQLSKVAPAIFGLQYDLAHVAAFIPIIIMLATTICALIALWRASHIPTLTPKAA